MKIKKIIAAVAAAAVAVSMTAFNAFAATVTLDSEYPGGWAASKGIPKAEFEAIGGDVKVVLTVEVKEPLVGTHNHLAKPMNMCVNWDAITSTLQSDTAIAKGDGFFVFADGQTTLEFVVPESVWQSFKGYVDEATGEEDESAGLYFQVNDVIIKSAELSAGSAQGAIKTVDEAQSADIMTGKSYEEVTGGAAPADDTAAEDDTADEAAPADDAAETTAAPAADNTTTSTATGNVPVAVMVSVMAVAGAAVIASRKRK